jgi:hypothetical protein
MKATSILVAVVSSLAFAAASAFANPALMPKKHEGYPNQGKGTTATGETALENSLDTGAPKTLKKQLQAEDKDRAGNVMTDDPRHPKHPGYPDHGVTENMIKEGTKVQANPNK